MPWPRNIAVPQPTTGNMKLRRLWKCVLCRRDPHDTRSADHSALKPFSQRCKGSSCWSISCDPSFYLLARCVLNLLVAQHSEVLLHGTGASAFIMTFIASKLGNIIMVWALSLPLQPKASKAGGESCHREPSLVAADLRLSLL